MKLILAGNYEQYRDFIIKNKWNPADCAYGCHPRDFSDLRLKAHDLYVIGTFLEDVENARELLEAAKLCIRR